MGPMAAIMRGIDAFSEHFGRIVSWLTLGTVLVCFAVVVLRYVFSIGSVCLQELYVWQHALVFMLGAGYTLLHAGHVRVDIFYARLSPRRRAWVDLFGTCFFMFPWLVVLVWYGWPYFMRSWGLLEASGQAGGCDGYFLLKSAIPLFALLLGVQGIALVLRSILIIAGRLEPTPVAGHGQEPATS